MSRYLLILLLFVLLGCKQKTKKTQMPPAVVEVVKVERILIPNRLEFTGEVDSNYDAIIQPRVQGYLTEINYTDGMPVAKGSVLYRIDPSNIQTDIAAARAMVESANAQLIEAENNYNRAVPLAKIAAISKSSLDEYEAVFKSAQANLRSAKAQLRNNQINYSYTTIKSPIDGIIGYADLVEGQYIGPATENAELNTVSNIDTIRVALSIPLPNYLEAIKNDSIDVTSYDNSALLRNINLTLADGTKYPYNGNYRYTQKNIGSSTGSVVIVAGFENPDWTLKIGQYVKVTADVGGDIYRMLVPQISVTQSQGVNSVWVIDDKSVAHFKKVKLGNIYGSKWIILDGIDEGDKVVVSGQMRLRNGEKVEIKPTKKI